MKFALFAVIALVAIVAVAGQAAPKPKPAAPVAPIAGGTSFANSNCAAGTCKYTDSKCHPCNAGTYEPAWGKSCAADANKNPGYACDNVPRAGHWSPASSPKTYACPAGTSSPGGRSATKCTQCNYGTITTKVGSLCQLCPEGTYQPAPGKTKCNKCPKNSVSVPDRGQCVKANGAPATKPAFMEIESEVEAEVDAEAEAEVDAEADAETEVEGDDEVHPLTPIVPGIKFPGNVAVESKIEKLKARVAGQ